MRLPSAPLQKATARRQNSSFVFEQLEERRLFSGGVEGIFVDELAVPASTYLELNQASQTLIADHQQGVESFEQQSYEIVFVDTGVDDYEQLVDDIVNNANAQRNINVVLLDSQQNGIELISSTLEHHTELDAIHIISHGYDGNIQLGNSQLNSLTLSQSNASIALWANAFAEQGDILIYGCGLAKTDIGQSFIDELSALTLTDVAASKDLTGYQSLGGDWDLEYHRGTLEASAVISHQVQQAWEQSLDSNSLPVLDTPIDFTEHVISTSADYAEAVTTADVDGDGDLDVLSASYLDDTIAWYENDGSQNFTERTITTTAGGATDVLAVDIDADGDLDVFSTWFDENTIAWYENDGDQNFSERIITSSANFAMSVAVADVNGDGDLDVLSASEADDTIAWYENNGAQTFTKHVVTSTADLAVSVATADMDGDGDLDVLSASNNDDTIAWYENNGDENSPIFTKHVVTVNADGAYDVDTADVDADGDIDVISTSEEDNTIAWYENDGSQNFTERTITTSAYGANDVFSADIDGDGDIDFAAASNDDDTVAWYENDGAGNFTQHTLSATASFALGVSIGDVDGDGDLDVLSASANDDTIAWHENTGPVFIENGSPIVINMSATVSDADLDSLNSGNGNYHGASLTLVRNSGANTDDVFSFNDANGISISGTNLIKNGDTIAIFDYTTLSGQLVVSFTDAHGEIPTSSDVDNILQQLTYSNTSDEPPASAKIDWTFSDGNNGSQGTGGIFAATDATIINITSINDVAIVGNNSTTVLEGATNIVLTSSDLSVTDVDNNDTTLMITASNVSNGTLSINGSAWSSGGNDNFTQQDIINGTIVYSHDGSNTTSDSFSFSVSDGTNVLSGQTMNISVTAMDDDTATVANSSLNVTEGSINRILTTSDLSATDSDSLDANLIFIVSNVSNGTLSINGSAWTSGGNDSFIQQDIVNGTIIYSHDGSNTSSDSFSFSVSDGTNVLSGQTMNISVTAVDDDTATIANNSLNVTEGTTNKAITTSDLSATDTDSLDANLIFTVSNVNNGTLSINGSAWISGGNDNFTQQDIINGTIVYNHDGSNTTSDSFSFSVSDGTNTLSGQTMNISVTAVDDDTATIANNSLNVTEGTTNRAITTSDLSATDTDSLDANLIFTVSNVSNGTLSINGSAWVSGGNDSFIQQDIVNGTIIYSHDGSNTSSDSFSFSISDGTNVLSGQTMNISVTAVDDDTATIANNSLNVTEGTTNRAITTSDLSATDTDSPDANLIFTVSNVNNGTLGINGSAWVDGGNDSFTQQDIINGAVIYNHDGSNTTSDSFSFSVSDGTNVLSGQTMNISIAAVDDDSATVANSSLNVTEESINTVLTTSDLSATDTDSLDANLIFTVSNVSNGTLSINGSAWVGGGNDSFTQQDIINGAVIYNHDGSNTTSDSFSFSVSDGTNVLSGQTMNISITAVNDEAQLLILIGDGIKDNDPDISVATINEEPNDDSNALEPPSDDLLTIYNYKETTNTDIVGVMEESSRQLEVLPADNNVTEVAGTTSKTITTSEVVENKFSIESLFNSKMLDDDDMSTEEIYSLRKTIENINKQLDEESSDQSLQDIKAQVVAVTTMSFAAVASAWFLRAGALLSSLVSTASALNNYDPLPILKSNSS